MRQNGIIVEKFVGLPPLRKKQNINLRCCCFIVSYSYWMIVIIVKVNKHEEWKKYLDTNAYMREETQRDPTFCISR